MASSYELDKIDSRLKSAVVIDPLLNAGLGFNTNDGYDGYRLSGINKWLQSKNVQTLVIDSFDGIGGGLRVGAARFGDLPVANITGKPIDGIGDIIGMPARHEYTMSHVDPTIKASLQTYWR